MHLLRKYFKLIVLAVLGILTIILLLGYNNSLRIKAQEGKPQFAREITPRSIKDMWGTPARNMFPDLVNPSYITSDEVSKFLTDDEDVFLFRMNNTTYVYPISIMTYHHIVNDTLEGKPVLITYCLLSNTPAVFSRQINGETLEFGVLGSLYYGNVVMYDKKGDSYWQQLTASSFHGSKKGERLTPLGYSEQTKWKYVRNKKNIKVLAPNRNIKFYQEMFSSYKTSQVGIESLPENILPDLRLPEFENGLGIVVGDEEIFSPSVYIEKRVVTNTLVGPWAIVVLFDRENKSHKIFRRFVDGKRLTFRFENEKIIDDETNSIWDYNGSSISGKLKGKKLDSPFYTQAYWYSWSAFYPDTKIE